jgi:hypothetical protein
MAHGESMSQASIEFRARMMENPTRVATELLQLQLLQKAEACLYPFQQESDDAAVIVGSRRAID